ncbi:hypothetical protein [aff. Roholtiella sp. LEGE 12411]|uniref:hypothetical protein n=1 Tax=aff. Roholtiella sp. LEGE 12411 TaxID=1828822 RepID=UPI00187F153A|nr:hypothetical protein [aff. Roholtiella sp. LEGE 12411]MBE9036581.1 hypothetical protein [aff. Roholtiella sp. LEGE 12411]
MLNAKPKKERLKLLTNGISVPTGVGLLCTAAFSMALISLGLQILNYGATRSLVKNQMPSLVQLSSGETISAIAVDPFERSPEVIKKFVSDSFIRMFSWDGLLQTFNEKGESITKPDPGVEVSGGKLNKLYRVTTKAYEAAFAFSEKQNFRAAFLQKLATMTKTDVWSGDMQVSLIPRFISEPRKIKSGEWEVDLVATLVTFQKRENAGSGIPFNKTVTVESITTPQTTPKDITDLAKKIYAIRAPGLEITKVVDLNLGERKK